jgi:hypothetical protein
VASNAAGKGKKFDGMIQTATKRRRVAAAPPSAARRGRASQAGAARLLSWRSASQWPQVSFSRLLKNLGEQIIHFGHVVFAMKVVVVN